MKTWVGITALLASGAFLAFARAWTPELRFVLLAHVVVGGVVVPAVLRGLFRRLRASVPELAPRTAFAALVLVVLVFLLPYLQIPIGLSQRATAVVWVALAVSGAVTWRGLRGWFGHVEWSTRLVLEVLHALLWAIAAVTGPLLVALGGGRALAMLFAVHRFGGLFMVALGLVAVARIGWVRLREKHPLEWPQVAVVAGALALVVLGVVEPRLRVREVTMHLSTIPWAERVPAERDALPLAVDPELLALGKSCGAEKGCHGGVLSDHARSSHDRSLAPPHIARVFALLESDAGPGNETTCLGCHYPRALAEPPSAATDPLTAHSDMGCVFCHSASRVELGRGAERGRTAISLRLDERSLEAFRLPERGDGHLGAITRRALDLTLGAHGRSLAPAVLGRDDFCLACHGAQIEPVADARSCVTCHMPPRVQLRLAVDGESESRAKSHLFPGTNLMLPSLLGDRPTLAVLDAWGSGEMLASDFPPEEYRAIPKALPAMGPGRLGEFRYLDASVASLAAPRVGGDWPIEVRTTNLSIDHGFPAGPMDLLEMWLEVSVADESGRVVFASGQLDERGRVPSDARRMGGHAIDRDGGRLEYYRVWRSTGDVVERALTLGQTTADAFSVSLPADVGRQLTVRARWRYRELNTEFSAWAYDGAPPAWPILDVARAFAQFAVDDRG